MPDLPDQSVFRLRSFCDDRTSPKFNEPEQILLGSNLFFAAPATLNDPYEGRPRIEFSNGGVVTNKQLRAMVDRREPRLSYTRRYALYEQLKRRVADPVVVQESRRRQEEWIRAVFQNSSLCCFFERLTPPLWAHYAANGSGYALVFSSDINVVFQLPKAGQGLLGGDGELIRTRAEPITYVEADSYPKIDLDEDWLIDNQGWTALKTGLTVKLNDWSNERERRIIRPGIAASYQSFNPAFLRGHVPRRGVRVHHVRRQPEGVLHSDDRQSALASSGSQSGLKLSTLM